MMPTLLDDLTVEAVHILADAVRRERVPGIVEFGVLDRALTAVAVEPTRENLTVADGVFDESGLSGLVSERLMVSNARGSLDKLSVALSSVGAIDDDLTLVLLHRE